MRLGLVCLLILVTILCTAGRDRNRGEKGVTQKRTPYLPTIRRFSKKATLELKPQILKEKPDHLCKTSVGAKQDH
jgi:hypothetical protein